MTAHRALGQYIGVFGHDIALACDGVYFIALVAEGADSLENGISADI